MYCPVCRHEYRPGFDKCAVCGVRLVETLPAAIEEEDSPRFGTDDELTAVFATGQASLIPVLKSVLDSANIPYIVEGEHLFGMEPGGWAKQVLPWGGVRFLVPRSRAEEALALLESADDRK